MNFAFLRVRTAFVIMITSCSFFFERPASANEYQLTISDVLPVNIGQARYVTWPGLYETRGHAFNFVGESFTGSEGGLFFGIGFSFLRKDYFYKTVSNTYSANYDHVVAEGGYWLKAGNGNRVIFAGEIGIGTLILKKDGQSDCKRRGTITAGFSSALQISYKESFLLLFGGGVSRIFVSKFTYNNTDFKASDFAINLNFIAGIGYKF